MREIPCAIRWFHFESETCMWIKQSGQFRKRLASIIAVKSGRVQNLNTVFNTNTIHPTIEINCFGNCPTDQSM